MYCRNCGKEVNEKAEICINCGVKPLAEKKFCQECGVETNANQELCIKCGVRLKTLMHYWRIGAAESLVYPSDPPKNPVVATLLSLLLVSGLGQLYLGQTAKFVAMLLTNILAGVVSGGILVIPMVIIEAIDAYKIGRKLEQGQPVGQWEFFWARP